MSIDETVACLANLEVLEAYVLVSETMLYLDVGHEYFHPKLKVRIYKSSLLPDTPFHFEVSHHVHTPEQMGPYHPSRMAAESEQDALREAVLTTTAHLKSAIWAGYEPRQDWLVPNEGF